MENRNLTAIDEYINKVYALVLLAVPGACQAAGILYTLEKCLGFLPTVNWVLLIFFDITCLIYLAIAIFLIRTGYDHKLVRTSKLKQAKYFLVIIMFVQFNFILYMIPSTEFWAFALLFTVATALLLDPKMVLITSLEITLSLIVSWIVRADVVLPVRDDMFIANMVNRVVCVILSLGFIWFMTWMVEHFLVHAKKDEMQKNNERVESMLFSVSELSEQLGEAGSILSNISDNESASAEDLSAASETLLSSNTELSRKSDDIILNLSELEKWERIVDEQMKKVMESSNELLDKSHGNEEKLQTLKNINEEVAVSMQRTNEIAAKLSDAVKEIDVTLNIISGISSSTNLLALNASIEAARAGEVGKGFAVVATEVGNLANDTKESLDEVTKVIARVQESVSEMKAFVDDNTEKLNTQSKFFNEVFVEIKEMIEIIHISINSINSMGDAHSKQSEVIESTVQINEDIAESIKRENAEFVNINGMVESNAADIVNMTEQVNILNQMVEKMNQLLSHGDEVTLNN